jgi:hypothetical protein
MAHPFLSNLGVDALAQGRSPTTQTFPLAFNQNNASDWAAAVNKTVMGADPTEDWGAVIKEYIHLCAQRGVYPFQNLHESKNDQIVDFLRERRRAFVHFVNITDFFRTLTLRATHRRVTATESGFVLTVYAHTLNTDPSFVKWLIESPFPRFDLVRKNGRYTKRLMHGLDVFVENDYADNMKDRWVVGYDIHCPMYPDLPTNHTPSKAEIERFVLDVCWMPLLRAMRPLRTTHRLI